MISMSKMPEAKEEIKLSNPVESRLITIKHLNRVGLSGDWFARSVLFSSLSKYDKERKLKAIGNLLLSWSTAHHLTKRYRAELKHSVREIYDEDIDEKRSVLWPVWYPTGSISWSYRDDERNYFDWQLQYFRNKLELNAIGELQMTPSSPAIAFSVYTIFPIFIHTKRTNRQFIATQSFWCRVVEKPYKIYDLPPCECVDDKTYTHYKTDYHKDYRIDMSFRLAEVEGVEQ